MAIVVPAILESSREGFIEKEFILKQFGELERVQVDFADGIFVKNKTLEIEDLEPLNPVYTWEAHLMIKAPEDFFSFKLAGFNIILVHYESYDSEEDLKKALRKIKALGLKVGLVINPETSIEVCGDFKDEIDQILIMGVVPGFQGSPFIPDTINKIKETAILLPNVPIEVDGGVNMSNIKELKQAGAEFLAVGSGLFGTVNPAESFTKLSDEIS